jgi:hypothetical protein
MLSKTVKGIQIPRQVSRVACGLHTGDDRRFEMHEHTVRNVSKQCLVDQKEQGKQEEHAHRAHM